MRYLSLFSGIEAATVAWHALGWTPVAFAQFDPEHNYVRGTDFSSTVLSSHYPNVPNLGDVAKITEQQIASLGHIDVIVFGSPCQDLSISGKRVGLEGERSGLFFTAINIINWARKHCGLRFALWENVYGAFSSNQGRDFASVVEQMAGIEDVDAPKYGWGNEGIALGDAGLLEWSTLDAQWFGVAQRRRRVFALADFGDWSNRGPILVEQDSLRGDSAPSRDEKTRIQHIVDKSIVWCREFCQTITSQYFKQPDNSHTNIGPNIIVQNIDGRDVVRKLTITEVERLFGFPDGYTKIPWKGKPAEKCPDGMRYKALGNSMATPVMHWIGKRIDMAVNNNGCA